MIIVGTDFHFGARNDDEIVMQNQLRFFNEVFFPACKKHNVTHFLDLGDTWDKRKILNIRTYNIFREHFFDKLKQMGIETYMLIGNHDIYYKNTNEVNSISQLAKDYDNIHIVNEFEDITINGCTFGMMSWINNNNLAKAQEFAKSKSRASIVCGHFETIGFDLLAGIKCEHGISAEWFDRFDEVWSGHFHVPSKKGNFEYIGNPFDLTWSDYGQRKSVILFDEVTREKTYLENPYRLFDVVSYDDSINILDFDFSDYSQKFVRVNIASFDIKDNSKLSIFLDSLQKEAYNVEVVEVGQLSFNSAQADITPDTTPQDTLTKILSVVSDMDLSGMDKSKLSQKFIDLYQDAIEAMSK